ncbi:hypothetical protein EK21DRAFT_88766 [Setomelanomma holmii]|uniref:Uncharacterized protein n=1 Tax=Setomelanomma holmii TaxID=210430 RepID=A0A9P4LKR2_9PLEO|nr:hypothetical protein EK21DRAFT_88766 [Setomelanomma holmii]
MFGSANDGFAECAYDEDSEERLWRESFGTVGMEGEEIPILQTLPTPVPRPPTILPPITQLEASFTNVSDNLSPCINCPSARTRRIKATKRPTSRVVGSVRSEPVDDDGDGVDEIMLEGTTGVGVADEDGDELGVAIGEDEDEAALEETPGLPDAEPGFTNIVDVSPESTLHPHTPYARHTVAVDSQKEHPP